MRSIVEEFVLINHGVIPSEDMVETVYTAYVLLTILFRSIKTK